MAGQPAACPTVVFLKTGQDSYLPYSLLDHGGLIGAAELAWQPVLDDPSLVARLAQGPPSKL